MKKLKFLGMLAATGGLTIGSLQAATQNIFGVLGRTPEDPKWYLTIGLFSCFLVSTMALAIGLLTSKESIVSKLSIFSSAAISCVWLGFYYGGIIGNKTPQVAIAIAIIGLSLVVLMGWYRQPKLTLMAIVLMGVVTAYGLSFLCSVVAVSFLSTARLLEASIWLIFFAVALATTIFFLNFLIRELADYRSALGFRL
ncbi:MULTISPECIES: hypothetical protein [unclassified Chamaesiphon]|uniref:hypothetical protein n=1 Tax=unclassified Chamaesiphon TaxID=2620921 RepID=UPI00286C561B|nr:MULTISPECIES: hypothetical protein [unclassified Chamaesiphon]